MNIEEHPIYIKLLRKLEPGNPITKVQICLFFIGLFFISLIQNNLAPIQPIKTLFLIITGHFFINFFYSFHAKIVLEKILSHQYKIILLIFFNLISFFSMNISGWTFLSLNFLFFIKLGKKFFSGSRNKWNIIILVVNLVCLSLMILFNKIETFTNQEGIIEFQIKNFFSFNYFGWALIPVFALSIIFNEEFDRQNDNVYHLGNLINFALISFLPFLFVLQKDEVPPMRNVFGFFMLIPLIVLGIFCLALFYFFISNLKSIKLFSFLNILSIFYIFIASDVFLSFIFRLVFLVGIILLCWNFPLRMNKFIINSFDEIETTENNITTETQTKNQDISLHNDLEVIRESDEERKYGSSINSYYKKDTNDNNDTQSNYSIELRENKLEEKLLGN